MPEIISVVILLLVVIFILVRCIRIVQQAKAYVIEFLGAYKTTWNVGLHFKIPFVEKVAKVVTLKEQVVDFRFQNLHNPKVAILSQKTDPGMESV